MERERESGRERVERWVEVVGRKRGRRRGIQVMVRCGKRMKDGQNNSSNTVLSPYKTQKYMK